MKFLVSLLVTAFLLGCTTQHAPFQAYEQKVPLSQTAVFMAMNQTGPLIQSHMLPKHVYRASYREADGKVHVDVVDLGENSEVGLDFSYMGYHKARFDDQ